MSLAELYARLRREAAQSGEDRFVELTGGARLCVRVQGDMTTLSVARHGKPVGKGELVTFQRLCRVPPEAARWPEDGQHERVLNGQPLYQVVFRWREVSA